MLFRSTDPSIRDAPRKVVVKERKVVERSSKGPRVSGNAAEDNLAAALISDKSYQSEKIQESAPAQQQAEATIESPAQSRKKKKKKKGKETAVKLVSEVVEEAESKVWQLESESDQAMILDGTFRATLRQDRRAKPEHSTALQNDGEALHDPKITTPPGLYENCLLAWSPSIDFSQDIDSTNAIRLDATPMMLEGGSYEWLLWPALWLTRIASLPRGF